MNSGKALVWLHKLDEEGDCEVELFIQSVNSAQGFAQDCTEDVSLHLGSNWNGAWGEELKRMRVGDWVRFTIKWEVEYHKLYDHYYGCYEYDSSVNVQRVRTLRRGHYVERYAAKVAA